MGAFFSSRWALAGVTYDMLTWYSEKSRGWIAPSILSYFVFSEARNPTCSLRSCECWLRDCSLEHIFSCATYLRPPMYSAVWNDTAQLFTISLCDWMRRCLCSFTDDIHHGMTGRPKWYSPIAHNEYMWLHVTFCQHNVTDIIHRVMTGGTQEELYVRQYIAESEPEVTIRECGRVF